MINPLPVCQHEVDWRPEAGQVICIKCGRYAADIALDYRTGSTEEDAIDDFYWKIKNGELGFEETRVIVQSLLAEARKEALVDAHLDYIKLQHILAMILWQHGGSANITWRTQQEAPLSSTELKVNENSDQSFTIKLLKLAALRGKSDE